MKGDLLMTAIPLGFNGRAIFVMAAGMVDSVTNLKTLPNLQVIPSGTGMVELAGGRATSNRTMPKHARVGRVVLFMNAVYMVCDEHLSPIPIFEVLASC